MRESAGKIWRCRVCTPASPPIPALSGPFRGVSGPRSVSEAGGCGARAGGKRPKCGGVAHARKSRGRSVGLWSDGSCPVGDGERTVLSPWSSKIGAGVCADQTAWGGGRRRASPPPCGRVLVRAVGRRTRPGGRSRRRGLRVPSAGSPGGRSRSRRLPSGRGVEAVPSRRGVRPVAPSSWSRHRHARRAGRLVCRPGGRAVEGAGRHLCRSGGGALLGGWAAEHLFIGANGETRKSEQRRQLRRQRDGSRPARGAVRSGNGSGEREGMNPTRPTHVSPWFQRWPGSGTTGEPGGRRFCGQARRPSRPQRGRRQSGIEAPTRRGLLEQRN